jgi:hypothetical protein
MMTIEWLLRRKAIQHARANPARLDSTGRARYRRASAAAWEARRLAEGVDGLSPARSRRLAMQAYCDAARWAFAACSPGLAPTIAEAVASADPRLLEPFSPDALADVARVLDDASSSGESTAAEVSDLAAARDFVRGLLAVLAPLADPSAKARRQRLVRVAFVGAAALSVVVGVTGGALALQSARRDALHPDLAAHAHWRVSSASGWGKPEGVGCDTSTGTEDFFFHTGEEASPWVEFDLGEAGKSVGLVSVKNRECCLERAVPLVVELSDDGSSWSTVATESRTFWRWDATFPRQHTRYVRLRVAKKSVLHLAAVEIR